MLRWFNDPVTRTLIVALIATVSGAVALPAWTVWSPDRLSPDSEQYLGEAIVLIKAHAHNAQRVDWDDAERRARVLASGAATPADTHAAIQSMLDALGDRRSALLPVGSEPDSIPLDHSPFVDRHYVLSDGAVLRIRAARARS